MDKEKGIKGAIFMVKKSKEEPEASDYDDFLSHGDCYINHNNKKKMCIKTLVDVEETMENLDENEEDESSENYIDPDVAAGKDIINSLLFTKNDNLKISKNEEGSKKIEFDPEGAFMESINDVKNYVNRTNANAKEKNNDELLENEGGQNEYDSTNNSINKSDLNNMSNVNNVEGTENLNVRQNAMNINGMNTPQMSGNINNMQPNNIPKLNPYMYSNANYYNGMNQPNFVAMQMMQNMQNMQGYNQGYFNKNMNNFYPMQSQNFCQQNPMQSYLNYSDASLAQISPFLIKEQTGCRFIQDKVVSNPQFANTLLFPYLLKSTSLPDLICDQFGNYLFQVLVDILSENNLFSLILVITPNINTISISAHGTRFMQKLIDKIVTNEKLLDNFTQGLFKSNLIEIMKDPYGNHIIQKFLGAVKQKEKKLFIYKLVETYFLDITNSKHGVCVVQKCFSEGTPEQRKKILDLIQQNIYEIITDQFGNYLIQYLLTANDSNIKELQSILDFIVKNVLALCKMKFSANVIEKCFENSSEEIKKQITVSMVQNNLFIVDLLLDPYGNYVVQKALMVVKGELYTKMLNIIYEGIPKIKQASFGNKLIIKLVNTHKELGMMLSVNPQHNHENLSKKQNHKQKNWKK